jgi:hypothetical protein
LETALAVLHDGRIDITFLEWQAEVPGQHARAEAQRMRNRPLVVFPVTRTSFRSVEQPDGCRKFASSRRRSSPVPTRQ